MKHVLALALALALATTMNACMTYKTNPVAPTYTPQDYYPLAVGNVWVYDKWDTDSTGTKVAGSDGVSKDSVVASFAVGSQTAFVIDHITSDSVHTFDTTGFDAEGNLLLYSTDRTTGVLTPRVWVHLSNVDQTRSFTTITSDSVGADTVSESCKGSIGVTGADRTVYNANYYRVVQAIRSSLRGFTSSMVDTSDFFFSLHVGLVGNSARWKLSTEFGGSVITSPEEGMVWSLRSYKVGETVK